MHKRFAYILNWLIIISAPISAQEFSDTLFFSNNGQSTNSLIPGGYYKVISADTSGSFQFLVQEYNDMHGLIMEGTYRSLNPDRKNGKFVWYYKNGEKEKECYYQDNKLVSIYKTWHLNGQLKQSSKYINGQIDGVSKSWTEDGTLKKEVNYKMGKKHGEFMTFYPNGKPIRIEYYKKGHMTKAQCYTSLGSDTVYFRYFTPPSFLDGDIAKFKNWVLEKIQYPAEAKSAREEAEVKVKFIIGKDGKVSRIFITKRDKDYFNKEVIRVISSSPIWSPALRDIDSIDVSVEIPIRFKLP